jgi:hypothetical protein
MQQVELSETEIALEWWSVLSSVMSRRLGVYPKSGTGNR